MIRQLDNGLTVEVNQLTNGKYKAYLYDPKDSFDLSVNKGTAVAETPEAATLELLVSVYGSHVPKFLDTPVPVMTAADYLRTLDVKALVHWLTMRLVVVERCCLCQCCQTSPTKSKWR